MLTRRRMIILSAGAAGIAACDSLREPNVALYVLHDVSGSYFRELPRNLAQIPALTATLRAGDYVAFARIDSCSFSNDAIVIPGQRISDVPSRRVTQLLALNRALQAYGKSARRTEHTDIRGALLQAVQQLQAVKAARRQIVIFSDLDDDLPPECRRDARLVPDLRQIDVFAVNVIKLPEDNRDPQRYFSRLATWKRLVETGGGTWTVAPDVAAVADQLRTRLTA